MIKSLIDLDFYKLTMGQFAYYKYPNVKVKYKFFNRKLEYKLANIIDKDVLVEQFEKISKLKLTEEESKYLLGKGFEKSYIEYLSKEVNLETPSVKVVDGQFDIEINGFWCDKILWETYILSTINELYYKFKYQDQSPLIKYGTEKNLEKYEFMGKNTDLKFMDFSTRRRYSYSWQKDVVKLMSSLPNFLGTSNVKIAMELDLTPLGTNAHELYMVSSGIHRHQGNLRDCVNNILDEWYDFYEGKYSVALPDTFGTDSFLADFGKERLEKFMRTRQDSGCPFNYGDKFIKKYKELGISPSNKYITFSDSLNKEKMRELKDYFKEKIDIDFGWGTNLGNDMGVETLSIVVKVFEVTKIESEKVSYKLVKLSDNLNKHMGTEEDIDLYKKVFDYENESSQEIVS